MKDQGTEIPKNIRVAVFGAGKMAMHHVKAIGLCAEARLVAVADPVFAKGEHPLRKEIGVELYTSAEELLSRAKPDVVHVCTPPDTHASLARLALENGAHIYLEKPFTLTGTDAVEVVSLAREKGLRVCAGHQLLFESPTLRAEEYLRKLGRIVHIESYFSFRPVRYSKDGKTAISPLEQLVDILPHPVYLLLHFLKKNAPMNENQPDLRALDVKASGSVHGILRCGDVIGTLNVTLEGRPIECYMKIVGTNGYLYADYVRGAVVSIPGPGVSAISKIMNPYRQSWQTVSGTTRGLFNRLFKKQKSYPGLLENIGHFYGRLTSGLPDADSDSSIVETVAICEEVGKKLEIVAREENSIFEKEHARKESMLPPFDPALGGVLITGGTGLLGKTVASEIKKRNRMTRVVARKLPSVSNRIPGVEYTVRDLAERISPEIFRDISVVVHCAAETAGGREAHERNSVGATRMLIESMNLAGVKKLVHISSIAVLKTGREIGGAIKEDTPLALDNEDRGPYVWGKAESERLAKELCGNLGIMVRIIRPGPLVDYKNFEPPGRLGREVGPWFISIGSGRSRLSLCSVERAAEVIRKYVEDFENMPEVLNLVEPDSPTRSELVSILLDARPDLTSFRMPFLVIRIMSPVLKIVQRVLRPKVKPIDIYAAFSPEEYDSTLAAKVIASANDSPYAGVA
jgi:predicted dehydrogenase/nucleoside-diphosphate-sugar epimerase